MEPGQVVLFAIGGLSNAAYLFIVAAGLSLVFGALRVINMAHGSIYMIAAFVTVVVANQITPAFGFWGGLVAALVITAVAGALIEIVVLRRVYREAHLVQLLGTYAVTLIVAGAVRIIFGPNYRTMRPPAMFAGSVSLGGYSYSIYSFFMIGAAIMIAAGVYVMLYRTSLGRNIRAAVSDPDLLRASGVNVVRLFTTVFIATVPLLANLHELSDPDNVSARFEIFLATSALVLALWSVSYNLMLGYAGMVSFAHAAYFGIGAYTVGLLFQRFHLPVLGGLVLAPVVTAAFGLVTGVVAMRAVRLYFSLLTLAISQLLYSLAFSWY